MVKNHTLVISDRLTKVSIKLVYSYGTFVKRRSIKLKFSKISFLHVQYLPMRKAARSFSMDTKGRSSGMAFCIASTDLWISTLPLIQFRKLRSKLIRR